VTAVQVKEGGGGTRRLAVRKYNWVESYVWDEIRLPAEAKGAKKALPRAKFPAPRASPLRFEEAKDASSSRSGLPSDLPAVGDNAGDREAVVGLYEASAGRGNVDAQVALGAMYLEGSGGVPRRDLVKAVELFRRAADAGDKRGQTHLGRCYAKGLGVPQSLAHATRLYQLAARQGHQVANKLLEQLREMDQRGESQNDRTLEQDVLAFRNDHGGARGGDADRAAS